MHRRRRAKTNEQRFREKIAVTSTGCWEWTAHRDRDGYGTFHFEGTKRGAHRVAYQLFIGPIPDKMHIDHLCRNRACVNPEHLEPVSNAVNLFRSPTTWATRNSLKTDCPKGHPYSGDNLRFTSTGARYCLECKRLKKAAWDARQRAAY